MSTSIGSLTVVTQTTRTSNAITHTLEAAIGDHKIVPGWDVAFVLQPGETRHLWLAALVLPCIPIFGRATVTNHGGGRYNVIYTWPLRRVVEERGLRQALQATTITGRKRTIAVI